MAEKGLKKMSRTELIEIIYALKTREEQLTERVSELEKKLGEREICIAEAGSIAEAALALNHIFEEAQKAADDYLLSVRRKCPGANESVRDSGENEDCIRITGSEEDDSMSETEKPDEQLEQRLLEEADNDSDLEFITWEADKMWERLGKKGGEPA